MSNSGLTPGLFTTYVPRKNGASAMARRVRGDFTDQRDWSVRAAEALAKAKTMPLGPARDEALRKAEQFRTAAEMKGYLSSDELKSPT